MTRTGAMGLWADVLSPGGTVTDLYRQSRRSFRRHDDGSVASAGMKVGPLLARQLRPEPRVRGLAVGVRQRIDKSSELLRACLVPDLIERCIPKLRQRRLRCLCRVCFGLTCACDQQACRNREHASESG
jgi:hypothetical protein